MLTLVRSTAPPSPKRDEDRPIRKSVLMRADAKRPMTDQSPGSQGRHRRATTDRARNRGTGHLSHPEKLRYYAPGMGRHSEDLAQRDRWAKCPDVPCRAQSKPPTTAIGTIGRGRVS